MEKMTDAQKATVLDKIIEYYHTGNNIQDEFDLSCLAKKALGIVIVKGKEDDWFKIKLW